jgi:hypothetical protein
MLSGRISRSIPILSGDHLGFRFRIWHFLGDFIFEVGTEWGFAVVKDFGSDTHDSECCRFKQPELAKQPEENKPSHIR